MSQPKQAIEWGSRFAVVTETATTEIWAVSHSRENMQQKIDVGYFHRYMYPQDKHKKLIIIDRWEKH